MNSESITFNILSVNISEKKGTVKVPLAEISVESRGIKGDAHSGDWNRQVSLLGKESIDKFGAMTGKKAGYGDFAENITTEGLELWNCHPLDRFIIGECELEVTRIGKECHGSTCAIFKETGDCVMPKEGIFCRVIRSGIVRPGDQAYYQPKIFNILVITLSDRASRGEYEDKSGPRVNELIFNYFSNLKTECHINRLIIPDDSEALKELVTRNHENYDIIITTGGTGVGPRDITCDTIRPLLDKEIPGIMEFIRHKYGSIKPQALLSRAIAGIKGKCSVYTLPGSQKAVNEYMSEIQTMLLHTIYMIHGLDIH